MRRLEGRWWEGSRGRMEGGFMDAVMRMTEMMLVFAGLRIVDCRFGV